MHQTAELGVAAHWKYKSGADAIKLDWLNNLGYHNESVEDFYELIKNDLYSEDISVFSPTGEAFTLPRGAVALDFAYAVHTEVGNKAKTALVNKEKVSLLTELQNGDIVKIEVVEETLPRCSWYDAVKTSKARTNIKHNCNSRLKEIDAKYAVNIIATIMNLNISRVEEWFEKNYCEKKCAITFDIDSLKEVVQKYILHISSNNRFKRFLSRHRFKLRKYTHKGISVYSNYSVSDVVFDYCCHPKTGDGIIAFLEKGKAHVHHKMCKTANHRLASGEKMIFAKWDKENLFNYSMIISLHSGKGTLAEFLNYLAKIGIDINTIELGKNNSESTRYCEIGFETKDGDINKLRVKIEQKVKVVHLVRTDDVYQ
jgi:GTP pyrophosphokinase